MTTYNDANDVLCEIVRQTEAMIKTISAIYKDPNFVSFISSKLGELEAISNRFDEILNKEQTTTHRFRP